MRTGIHLGLGQGYEKALEQAKNLGINTVQIFTHSPRSYQFKELSSERQQVLLDSWKSLGIDPVVSHASYLINVASQDNKKFHGALNVLKKELIYAKAFGCDYVVLHSGKYTDATVEEGVSQIAKALAKLEDTFKETKVMLLLEIASGQGTEIGRNFSELQQIIDALPARMKKHVGVCLDTCHLWAAGYDIGNPDEVSEEIKRTVGLEKIKVIHVNGSKFPLGANRDRHEHLWMGEIPEEKLQKFLNHKSFKDLPKILETPIDDNGDQGDDLKRLRKLIT